VTRTGQRGVLGFDVGAAETFYLAFLRSLVARGLKGVGLVIADAREGLKRVISEVLAGASWPWWRVHFMRNLLARILKHAQRIVAACCGRCSPSPTYP